LSDAALSPRSKPFVETSNQKENRTSPRRHRPTRSQQRASHAKIAPQRRHYAIFGE